MAPRAIVLLFTLSQIVLSIGTAEAQLTSIAYHLVGVVREMPTDHAVVSDYSDGSSKTEHEIVLEIIKSDPPLWGGKVLRVRYQGSPTIGEHTVSPGDTLSFTLKQARDPGNISWPDIDARM